MTAMQQGFTFTLHNGETHEVTTAAGDLVRLYQWAGNLQGDNPAHHAYLIWCAAKRSHQFDGDFDTFVDELADYEAVDVPKAPSKKRSPSS